MDISRDNNIIEVNFKKENKRIKQTPVWEKELLTVVEAAKYFGIGEKRIRKLTKTCADKPFICWRDNTFVFIKRKEFEKYLDGISEL